MAAGLEYEFFDELSEELTCSICMKVLCEPHMVNCCEQQFCKKCLEKWMLQDQSCPHCRSRGFSHMLLKQRSRKIGELKVYCPNKQHGCQTVLKMTEYDQHVSPGNDKGCLYVELDCLNKCEAKVFRGEMKAHLNKKCRKRLINCKYCKIEGEHETITGSHLEKCPSHPLPCPKDCGEKLIRKNLESHRDSCPLEPVLCPFSGLGCKVQVCRKDLEKHVETNTLQHVTVLAQSHTTLLQSHTTLLTKLNNIGSILENSSVPNQHHVAQIKTILKDTSKVVMNGALQLSLFEGNEESSQHYIILSKEQTEHKFKLEWEADKTEKLNTRFTLYSITDQQYPPVTHLDIALTGTSNQRFQICCKKEAATSTQEQVGTFTRPRQLQNPLTLQFKAHYCHDCKCQCHPHECTYCGVQCSDNAPNHTCSSCGKSCLYGDLHCNNCNSLNSRGDRRGRNRGRDRGRNRGRGRRYGRSHRYNNSVLSTNPCSTCGHYYCITCDRSFTGPHTTCSNCGTHYCSECGGTPTIATTCTYCNYY